MSRIYTQLYKSPLGDLIIGDYKGKLCMLDWQYRSKRKQVDDRLKHFFDATFEECQTDLLLETIAQLEAYLSKEIISFSLPFVLAGSSFQQQVWQALLQIPYGSTSSYLALSRQLGNEKAIRAVAAANGANAISVIIPCHRVIGSDGALTGYAGGLKAKQHLLNLESVLAQGSLF